MIAIPRNEQTEAIARRVVWFDSAEKALQNPVRFMAYAFTYALHADMKVLRGLLSDDALLEALRTAPPGIIDPRSWAYWHSKLGCWPPPPMPVRRFPEPSE
jgi:hypothetical protein